MSEVQPSASPIRSHYAPGVPVIQVRFLCFSGAPEESPDGEILDYELPAVPNVGHRIDLGMMYEIPCWTVDDVWWTPNETIPADVVVFLSPYEER